MKFLMTTTAAKLKNGGIVFSPSVNIIRDANTSLNYIPTPNSKQVFNQLVNDFQIGIRSFSIIGAYGTGKSAFLWALEKNLNQKHEYFSKLNPEFKKLNGFAFLPFIGEYDSITESFADQIEIDITKSFKTEHIIQQIDLFYNPIHNSGKGLVIVIDEFGKYLEYAAKNNPENELYFVQRLAEYVNDTTKNIFLITTLHQDFNGYSRGLTKTQQNEWDKVKGRLKEITFNEPVEQLLYLASERISELNKGIKNKDFTKLFKSIETAKAFPLRDYFNEDIAEKLLPFDILSAAVLTLSLQKYGQNERSLFSFIESSDRFGLDDYDAEKNPYYNLSCVYDYLIHNYYSFLTTRYNPHQVQWTAIRSSLERAEGAINGNVSDTLKILKVIGLLNIFASASIRLNIEFLSAYCKHSLGIKDSEQIIKALEGLRIIRFVKHINKYILFEGTDLDIELAIDEAGNLVEKVSSVVHHLNTYFDFPYISAKAVYYEKGTPRYFAFHLSETPETLYPEGEIDGYINLIFSDSVIEDQVKKVSEECEEAILYGWYRNTGDVKNLLFEIEKIKKVRENHLDDRIAVRELDNILAHQIKLLNHYVLGNLYTSNNSIIWFFKGKKVHLKDQKNFNRYLTEICNLTYGSAPIYRNEMVNKTKLSSPIAGARKGFLHSLIENWHEKDLGFAETKFPPEKTIYLSLLRETGIHHKANGSYALGEPTNQSANFTPLWEACNNFIISTKNGRRSLHELTSALLAKPFKLKQGFLDFWLPVFLFTSRDDFALFHEDTYIPFITMETLELVSKDPKEYEIKAFDIEGINLDLFNSYRTLLGQSQQENPTKNTFIETIRPFLTFYGKLPQYAKSTKKLRKETLALREAIANSKDPEETFFELFPKALGYNKLQLGNDKNVLKAYVNELQLKITEIRTCYDELILRLEGFIQIDIVGEKLSYPGYKDELQNRFKKIKKHLLLPYQKTFHQRIGSELDDNKGWLNSITQACIGKSLEVITDDEELILYEKLLDIIHELDNLCEISKSGFDENKEIVFKLEVTSFVEGLKKNLVRLPKSKNKELIQLHSIVKAKLSDDKQLNIAALAKLLEELLENGK